MSDGICFTSLGDSIPSGCYGLDLTNTYKVKMNCKRKLKI